MFRKESKHVSTQRAAMRLVAIFSFSIHSSNTRMHPSFFIFGLCPFPPAPCSPQTSLGLSVLFSNNIFFFFPANFRNLLPKERERVLLRILTSTFKTEYTSIRYVPCITSRSRRCAKTCRKKASDNIYTTVTREAPDRRRPVQGIMILLYGAGGEPSGGEIPMNRNQSGV